MNKLVFGDTEVSKKVLYEVKKAVNLSEFDVDKIVESNKIIENNETNQFFVGYMDDISGIVTPYLYVLFYHK